MKNKHILILSALATMGLTAVAQQEADSAFVDQHLSVGANRSFTRATSAASVSVITEQEIDQRSAKNIGNAILGQGNGLISLQGGGTRYNQDPTFYIYGLQSLSGSTPLILIDGIERDITMLDPGEVLDVQILKDAAATALYGYKGMNGAILIQTKRGQYNSKVIRVKYEHVFSHLVNAPKFVNGPTYALAMNEALANEGQAPKYSADEISAFQSGAFPYQYPNVDWVGQTFRHNGLDDHASIEFSGGGEKFRYFTYGSIFTNKGFIKSPHENEGYSTQDKFTLANIRTNLDVDLTPTTQLRSNVYCALSEMSCPGSQANLWNMMYNIPSVAFPIKNENGTWGGSSTWAGTNNPIAQSTGAAYYKLHDRALFFDGTLDQNLSMVLDGLSATLMGSYDVYSTLYEDHSKEYLYGYYPVTGWENGQPVLGEYWEGGKSGEMGTGSATNSYQRRFDFAFSLNYNKSFGKSDVYAQLKYDYDFQELTGVNTKIYRRNYSFFGQYAFDKKYILGVTLMESGSSRLAPGSKWSFSPTVSAAWAPINDPNASLINFFKLRASYGQLNADLLPNDSWTYYIQSYSTNGTQYAWGSGHDSNDGGTTLGQMATANPSHEKAKKLNIGFDATFIQGLDIEFDFFNQHRYDIWIDGSGAYSKLIGFTAPYVNGGIVDQHGIDIAVDYTKSVGDIRFNVGGTFLFSKSKIKEMGEEPRAYANLVRTGDPLNSIYGLKSMGLFTSQEEIDAAPVQTFSTVRPGDIRYVDVNEDGRIDANDVCRIGYSNACPEIYYTFHLGAEYKGLGFNCNFQGTSHYSALLNTQGYYWGLINNSSLAQEVYDARWSPENNNANAAFPRLSSNSNPNNYQTSDYWLRDRSFLKLRNLEVYYKMPSSLLSKTGFINGCKIYVRGNDLFTIDHIDNKDPECLGATMPSQRDIIVGAQLTF